MKNKTLAEEKIQNTTQESEWVWGLIGNILEEHEYGENNEIRRTALRRKINYRRPSIPYWPPAHG